MNPYVLDFQEIDQRHLMAVGGKGANLGELLKIEGIQVPTGFCVTTEAYKKVVEDNEELNNLLAKLSMVKAGDPRQIKNISEQIRKVIKDITIPQDIAEAVTDQIAKIGENQAYAVRSSATAEDLPHASFAGQQDTYLNIIGKESILQHISKCWASLFTDRAVTYRIQNGFDHHKVYLAVVIQQMVFPTASGIVFTADPVTSNRKVLSIDASLGLGEALVSGLVNADNYKVRDGHIVDKKISTKKLAIYADKAGGTKRQELEPERQNKQTLSDEQILQLAKISRKIEQYFGQPQDIEWCISDEDTSEQADKSFFIVQSRPITTLFPIPEGRDTQNRVFISAGHMQMMTDALKPLGMSFFEVVTGDIPTSKAGGRLFVDLTHDLASYLGRKIVLAFVKNDPLFYHALLNLVQRKAFTKSLPKGKRIYSTNTEGMSIRSFIQAIKMYRKSDPTIIQELMDDSEQSIQKLQQKLSGLSGDKLFSFISQDLKQLKKNLSIPKSMGALMIGPYAENWLNKNIEKWLGEKHVADTLSRSVGNNVTTEMGLELLKIADVVRQHSAVIEYFNHANDHTFFEDLAQLDGGDAVSQSVRAFLKKYGMRCPGEIDITKPRWSEQPTALIPMILNNIQIFAPNVHKSKFEQGRLEAQQKEQELISRLQQLSGGKRKAKKTQKMIRVLRNFIGYREYPKYVFVQHFYLYKQALLKEAAALVQKGLLRDQEDVYYLSFEEFRQVVKTNQLDFSLITQRKEEHVVYEKLTPPRIITSEGEIISGKYDTDTIPQNALPGIPVSSGVIEGRARVVLKIEEAHIEDGDILVTTFTDPSWTPLFVSVKGLVTEVGGQMTHGAVIAREYGLPAVVGVENATKNIKDGQRIRINGTEGFVEIL